jgi:Zn-dependent peptidase ImmA (M78 family)
MTVTKNASYKNYITSSIPVNIEAMFKSFDIELDKNSELPDGVLGEISKEGDRYKVSIRKTDHYYRKRFTMAHELGHFVLHKDKIGNGIDDSDKYRKFRRTNNAVGEPEEREANNFAANILMPEDLVVEYAKDRGVFDKDGQIDQDALQEIATAFQVSKAAMEIRIGGLKQKILTN